MKMVYRLSKDNKEAFDIVKTTKYASHRRVSLSSAESEEKDLERLVEMSPNHFSGLCLSQVVMHLFVPFTEWNLLLQIAFPE